MEKKGGEGGRKGRKKETRNEEMNKDTVRKTRQKR